MKADEVLHGWRQLVEVRFGMVGQSAANFELHFAQALENQTFARLEQ